MLLGNEYVEPSFYAWQSHLILELQGVRTPGLNSFFNIVESVTKGTYYPVFIVAVMILYDFILGYQMAVLMAFNVIASLNIKYWARGGRPFWTNRDVIPLECHVQSFGFPSGHVQAPMVLFLYFWMYVKRYKLPQKKYYPLHIFLALLYLSFVLISGFSRIYEGVHFFHDLAAGYLIGGIIVAFHMLFLVPFVIRPLARHVMKGKLTQLYQVVLILLVSSVLVTVSCFLSTYLPERVLGFPDNNWKIISNTKCKQPISAFSGYKGEYFKMLGVLYGTALGMIINLRDHPFVSHTQNLWRRILRIPALLIVMSPIVGLFLLVAMVVRPRLPLTDEIWSTIDLFMGVGGGLYFMVVALPILRRIRLMEVNREEWDSAMEGHFMEKVENVKRKIDQTIHSETDDEIRPIISSSTAHA